MENDLFDRVLRVFKAALFTYFFTAVLFLIFTFAVVAALVYGGFKLFKGYTIQPVHQPVAAKALQG